MTLFKRIEYDMAGERARIAKVKSFTKKQRDALLKLCDLFETGKWQECCDHVNDEKAFPYNKEGEYPEQEHIGIEIANVLKDLRYYNYYTKDQLINDIADKLRA